MLLGSRSSVSLVCLVQTIGCANGVGGNPLPRDPADRLAATGWLLWDPGTSPSHLAALSSHQQLSAQIFKRWEPHGVSLKLLQAGLSSHVVVWGGWSAAELLVFEPLTTERRPSPQLH